MDKRKIPTKNYIILIGVIVLVITACLATYNLYNIGDLNTPYNKDNNDLYNKIKEI